MITQKGVQPPDQTELSKFETEFPQLGRWLRLIYDGYPKVNTYSQELTPISVAANTTAEQSFTVNGLTASDIVIVNKPSLNAGIGVVNARVSAANTLTITYINATASPIIPTMETYNIIAVRL